MNKTPPEVSKVKNVGAETTKDLTDRVARLEAGNRSRPPMHVFAMESSKRYASEVVKNLGIQLSPIWEKTHLDTEFVVRSEVNVRNADVFVIQSLYADENESVNDKLQKLLMFISSLWDASAGSITAIIPYYAYARQGRKSQSRENIATKLIANQFEIAGATRVLTIDIHDIGEVQNSFRRCRYDNLTFRNDALSYLVPSLKGHDPREIAVVSPDIGGLIRAREARKYLMRRLGTGIGLAVADKNHDGDNIETDKIIGDSAKVLIGFDDMIAGGSTTRGFIDAAVKHGAKEIYYIATHGLFIGSANEKLDTDKLTGLIISDTIPPFRLSEKILKKTTIISTTKLVSEAISRTYTGAFLSSLFV